MADLWTPLLLALLTHQSFAVREAAEAHLAARGPSIQHHLAAALKSTDAELARRAWRVYDANRADLVDWSDVASFPWIDALPIDYPGRDQAMKHLTCHGSDNDWAGYRQATWTWLRGLAQGHGEGPSAILSLLRLMREREVYWRENGRYPPD